jgi:hypothetical protein
MAKIKFSALVSDMRGKLNGSVASHNRGGSYFRNKVTPVNVRSSYQIAARARFASFSQQWRTLTQAQIFAWNSAVGAYAKKNIFGNLKNPTGAQLFQKVNNNLLASGGTAITSPAAPKGVAIVTAGVLTYTSGVPALSLAYSANVPALTRVKVYATPPMSAGISFVKTQFRLITTLAPAAVSPANLLTPYNSKFGAVGAVGTKIFIKIIFVDQTSGIASPPQFAIAVSAA